MKRFLLFLLTASLVHAQTYPVKVDVDGDVLHDILVSTTNPAGVVNFGAGKLLVNGVIVGGGGSGTVTNFSAGDLSPLFTTTEATTTTTPVLSFVLSTAPSNSFFGNGTGSTAVPTFMSPSTARTALALVPGTNIPSGSGSSTGTNTGDQDLSGLVPNTRMISTTVPLTGGGDLSANRTLAINNAAADGTTKGAASFTANDFDATSGNVSLDYVNGQKATTSLPGFLSAADWTTFNGKQPLDGDLTALAAASRVGAIYYRSTSTPTWDAVKYGAGIQFVNGVLNTVNTNAQIVSEATKSSSSTLNLSGETETNYDITGTTNISAITLEEGRTVLLRFTGAGLTLTPGASLLLPGGWPVITVPNAWGLFLGGASGVVTCTQFNKNDIPVANFDGGTIQNLDLFTFRQGSSTKNTRLNLFTQTPGSTDRVLAINVEDDDRQIRLSGDLILGDKFATAGGEIDLVSPGGTVVATLPPGSPTIASLNGTETLTNKTIDASQLVNGTVTLAKQANMATASVLYRKSSGSGIPEINTLGTLKTDLGLTGTNSGDQTITLTGDVTGSGTGSFATTVAAGAITFAKLNSATWDDDTGFSVPSSTRVPTTNAVATFVADYIAGALSDLSSVYLPFTGGTLTGQLIAQAGSTASNSAGIKLTSGALQTTAQAGAFEFLTDGLYFTKTTGLTRMAIPLGPAVGPITFVGPTSARTITLPNVNFTAARTDAANTFTGVQTMTSPAITTPAITGLATGSGVASAATASTLVARNASGDITGNKLISGNTVRLTGYTVATLPAGTQGDTAFVTDALAPTFLAVIVGGGSVVSPVFYNGTNWVGY